MDAGIGFFFWFWAGDAALAPELVESIRQFYEAEPIIAIADGPVGDRDMQPIVEAGAQIFVKPHLKEFGRCGDFLRAGISQVLQACPGTGRFIMVDPETRFHRRPYLPQGDWVGQIQHEKTVGRAVLGAGQLFSRRALEEVVAELEGDESDFRYANRSGKEMPSSDLTLASALIRLGYSPMPWCTPEGISEVRLLLSPEPVLSTDTWAITHPHGT